MNENISAYISLEKGENGQEIISSYENTLYGNVCCGDIAIANEEIFEISVVPGLVVEVDQADGIQIRYSF